MSDATNIAELKERYNNLPPTIFDIAKELANRSARTAPVDNEKIIRFSEIILEKKELRKFFENDDFNNYFF